MTAKSDWLENLRCNFRVQLSIGVHSVVQNIDDFSMDCDKKLLDFKQNFLLISYKEKVF